MEASVEYKGRPFTWDRPNNESYPNGVIRVMWKDEKGQPEYCRLATDEEVRFIVQYELNQMIFDELRFLNQRNW